MGVQLGTQHMTEGGGLLDDVDGTIQSAEFAMYDYEGKAPETPCLHLAVVVDGSDEETHQYMSVGAAEAWEPTDDGKGLEPLKGQNGLVRTSTAGLFLNSLGEAGFPQDKMGDDISVLDGTYVHFGRVKAPKRAGLDAEVKEGSREKTVLVVTKVHELPWDSKGKGKGKGKGGGGGKSSRGGSDEALEEMAQTAMAKALVDNDGSLAKAKIATAIMPHVKDLGTKKNKVLKVAMGPDFLGGDDRPWEFNGKTVVGDVDVLKALTEEEE